MYTCIRAAACLTLLFNLSFTSDVFADDSSLSRQTDIRIISLAPSITEIVFALGAGKQVVGVTNYCDYPPEAKDLSKVGGFLDSNFEAIVALQPTIIFGLPEHGAMKERLTSFGLATLLVKQDSLKDIFNSIRLVGEKLNKDEIAEGLVDEIQFKVSTVRNRVRSLSKPTVLVTVGGHVKRGSLDSIYAAGLSTLYSELVEIAGGTNIVTIELQYAKLSAEALLTLNPEVVIDLVPSENDVNQELARRETLAVWENLPKLQAVKLDRVHVLDQEFVINPGPRITKTLELFARAIHP